MSEDMTQCPHCGDYHPNCDALGYCPVQIDEYAASRDYMFEITSDGIVRDRFSFYGTYGVGMELAEQRAARFESPAIHVEI